MKEADPPLFGERFSFVTDMLVTNAAATSASDKGKGTLYVTKIASLNPKPVGKFHKNAVRVHVRPYALNCNNLMRYFPSATGGSRPLQAPQA